MSNYTIDELTSCQSLIKDTLDDYYNKEKINEFLLIVHENAADTSHNVQDLNEIVFENSNLTIYWDLMGIWSKMPSKRDEDAGFDIYSSELEAVLKPGETKLFSTGLRSAFPKNYWIEIKERGSTGAVGLSVRSGVIDSGYRGEWKIMLTNVNNYPIEFSHDVDKVTYVYGKIFKNKIKKVIYPLSKAIAQAVVIPLPTITCKPWDEERIEFSERGQTG